MSKIDIVRACYDRLRTEPEFRKLLIADTKAGFEAHFGKLPEGDYKIKAISQEANKITILLPAVNEQTVTDMAGGVSGSKRIFDILYTDGVGGYLIADERLTWVLRDMRALWHGLSDGKEAPSAEQPIESLKGSSPLT